MSKYIAEPQSINVRMPLCTTCKKLKDNICDVYKDKIPKEIRFEYGNCKYYKNVTDLNKS